MKIELIVDGIHCNSCVMLIEDELEDQGAKNIVVTKKENNMGHIMCETNNKSNIIKAIENLGDYEVK